MQEPKQLSLPFGAQAHLDPPQQLVLFPQERLTLETYTYECASLFADEPLSDKFLEAILQHDVQAVRTILRKDQLFLSGSFGHEVMKFAMVHSRHDMWQELLTMPQHWRTVFDEDDRDVFSTLDVWAVLKLPTERMKSLLDWGAVRLWGIFDRTIRGTVFDAIMFYGDDDLVEYVWPAWEQHLHNTVQQNRNTLTVSHFQKLSHLAELKNQEFSAQGAMSNEEDFLIQRWHTRWRRMLQSIVWTLATPSSTSDAPDSKDPFAILMNGEVTLGGDMAINKDVKRFFFHPQHLKDDVTFLLEKNDVQFWGELAPHLPWEGIRKGLIWFLEHAQGPWTGAKRDAWEKGVRRMSQLHPEVVDTLNPSFFAKNLLVERHFKTDPQDVEQFLMMLTTDVIGMTHAPSVKRKI